jgi:hypothetical protein
MDESNRGLGHLFGIVGGALICLGGIIAAVFGIADAALGRGIGLGVASLSEALLLFVVGGLVLFFTYLGGSSRNERALTSGILLVVLAVVGWGVLGLGGNLVALVGSLFAFLAGLLYLVDPARRAAHAVVESS